MHNLTTEPRSTRRNRNKLFSVSSVAPWWKSRWTGTANFGPAYTSSDGEGLSMKKNSLLRTLRIAAAVLAVAGIAAAQDQGTDNGREFHWTGKLAPDQVLVIKDINGNIDANGSSSGDQVEVSATKSGSGAQDVKIRVMKLNDGVMICAVYPGFFNSDNCDSNSHFGNSHNNARVDFSIRMPRNVRFTGKNVNGEVNAESMGRYVEATSVNGSIHIATSSWASANTVNGSIDASLGRTDWSGDLEFKSVNGHLDSDFPLTVQGSIGRHSVHGTIGSGGRTLDIKTVNGSGELRKRTV